MTPTSTTTEPTPRVTISDPGPGAGYGVLGTTHVDLLTAEQTGGRLSLVLATVPPGIGPPPHRHGGEDEAFYVLSGTFLFVDVGGGEPQEATCGPGAAVYAPKGSLHTYRNIGETTGALLVVLTPGGLEQFFRELSALPAGPPDIARVVEIAGRHQLTFALGPAS